MVKNLMAQMNKYKVNYRRAEKSFKVTGMIVMEAECQEEVFKKFHDELRSRMVENYKNCVVVKITDLSEIETTNNRTTTNKELKFDNAVPFVRAFPGSSQDAANQWCQLIRSFFPAESKMLIKEYLEEIRNKF